jgi:hypothetical protein
MNRAEAKAILLRRLVVERRKPYAWHANRVGETASDEVVGRSGVTYQVKLIWTWDSQPGGDVRVLGSIDDGGWRAWCPIAFGFLVTSA